MRGACVLAAAVLLAAGCSGSPDPDTAAWDGQVRQWGTLREVMHGEVPKGQVRLSEVTAEPHVYGIGAPDGLRGEILIADSVAWVAEVRDGQSVETRRAESGGETAAFLAVARVPRWAEVRVDRDVSADQFDDFVQEAVGRSGLAEVETVPFVIEGRFSALELHVLDGQCPFSEREVRAEGAGPPYRKELSAASGRLVGFYSDSGAGRITHHWTRSHVHALVDPADQPLAGHVDAVAVKAGSVLRVPAGFVEP